MAEMAMALQTAQLLQSGTVPWCRFRSPSQGQRHEDSAHCGAQGRVLREEELRKIRLQPKAKAVPRLALMLAISSSCRSRSLSCELRRRTPGT